MFGSAKILAMSVLLEPIDEAEEGAVIVDNAELGGLARGVGDGLQAAGHIRMLMIKPLTPVEKNPPLPPKTDEIGGHAAQLRARNFHHLHFEQDLLHAADADVVDHFGRVVRGELHDRADVVGPIDEAGQHQAFAVAEDLDRGVRELSLQRDFELAGVAVDHHVDACGPCLRRPRG